MTDTPESESFEAAIDGFPVADRENLPARDALEVLMTKFAGAVRSGEAVAGDAFAAQHREDPESARDLLPLVELLERWKLEKDAQCARQSLPTKLPFQRLGQYEILRELGRGGMGIVVEARETRSLQHVAIKLLPWQYAGDMAMRRQRFYREAATIGGMRHPNIVTVHGYGERDGYCYYVMDLVEGTNLVWVINRLRTRADAATADEIRLAGQGDPATGASAAHSQTLLSRDSWTTFASIGAQAATALSYAHRRNVLHNDVKPGNLLLDYTGRVFLTDFGVGLRRSDELPGESDHALATLRYMAPERLGGTADVRSDVYSLGVTLYELITRAPAFPTEGRTELLAAIRDANVTRPRKIDPEIPRRLEAIVLTAMHRAPEHRHPTADALAADLLQFANRRPLLKRARSLWRKIVGGRGPA